MELLVLIPLAWMIGWDFRTRNVLVWHLLLFGLLQTGICLYKNGVEITAWNTLINTIVLLIIGLGVGAYALLRFKGKKQAIGMGDIVFILLLTPCFTSKNFLYFLIISFTLTLLAWAVYGYWKPKRDEHIPLISGTGICYACLLIYHFIISL